jgi:hypothetical protein
MKAESTSETSVNIYQITRRNIPEGRQDHHGLNKSVMKMAVLYGAVNINHTIQ